MSFNLFELPQEHLDRLRIDQLERIQEVGGNADMLGLDELLEIQAATEDVSDFQAGRMAAGAALETGIAGLLSAAGFEDTAESTMKSAEQTQEELALRYQRDVPSIVESFETQGVMGGISDLPEFLKETLAFSLPQTGAALAAGAAGTLVGGPLTGLATATAVGTPIFAGYNIQRQMEEQNIGFEDAQVAKAYGVGVGQAALDAVLGRVLGLFGRTKGPEEIAKAAQRGMANRIARKAGAGVAIEAPTETLQQSFEIIQANPEKFFEFGPDVQKELLESAIAGGLLGGAISAPTGIIRPTDPLKEKEQDLDRHMQEEAAEAAEMQRNAEFLAGETKALGAPMLGLPSPAPLTVTPEGETIVPEDSSLRPVRGFEPVIRQPEVGAMPEEVRPRLEPPAPVSVTSEGVGIVPPESTLRAQEERREPIIRQPSIGAMPEEVVPRLEPPAPIEVGPEGEAVIPPDSTLTPMREPREPVIRQPAIGEMPVEEQLALPPAGQVPIQMPAELPEARQPVIRQPSIGDPIQDEAMDLLGLPKPEDVDPTIRVPRGGFTEPGPIEITPEGAVTQPSIDLAVNPFGDAKVQESINKIASDEVPQLDTNALGKVQMNLSTDKYQVYKRRDPSTNAFVYSVTDGQNVIELNRDPYPPAQGMNYTQDILNSSRVDSVSTIPASNIREAVDDAISMWDQAQFKTPAGTTPKQKSRARTQLRKRLRELGLSEARIKKIVDASPAGLQAARKYSKKADTENAAKVRENAKKFATDTERSQYNQLAERVRKVLIKRLRALGLRDVALDFENAIIPGEGQIAEGYATTMEEGQVTQQNQAGKVLIALSSQIYKPNITEAELTQKLGEVMNHEMIHAIKMLGLFTPQEYTTLVNAAKAQAFVDKKGTTRRFTYFERAQRLYGDQSAEIQEEEAVAELFRDWAAGRKKIGGKPVSLFRRIVNFLKGIAQDADAEGIFKKIESGEVGARERGTIADTGSAMFSRKPVSAANPFGVDMNRTVLPVYPERYIDERKVKNKKQEVVAHRLTGDTQFTPNKTNLLDAARWIQEKIRNATGIGAEKVPYTDENVEPLAQLMATEAMRALEEDSNAIGWYDAQITAAKRLLNKIEPRIFESRTNESAFDWALAVTSNGQAVAENFGLALEVFRFYMNNGRFPVKEFKKGGDRNSSMRSSFSFFNQYQDMYQKGEVTTPVYDFLDSEFTVRDLQEVINDMNNEFGTDISVPTDELQDTVVFGSYLAGPKIGQGFYQNLRGNFEPLTMDIWWMRMWNRLVNRPFKPETPQSVINQKRTAFRKEIMEQAKLSEPMQIILGLKEFTFPGKTKPFMGALQNTGLKLSDLRKNEEFDGFVPAFNRAWNRYYNAYRDANGRPPEKPQIFNDMSTLEGDIYGLLQATPANGTERNYMRQVTARARQLLQTQGIDINTADMQALLWYPEKRLFEALGVPKGQGQDTDYLEAAILQARKEGLTDAEIEETLADPRSGQVDTRTSAGESVPDTDQKDDSPTRLSRKGKPTSEIIELATNNPEGFTLAIEGDTPTSGFSVAPVKDAEIVSKTGRVTEEEVNNLLAYAIEISKLSGRPAIVGGWRNDEDGLYYLDAVHVYDNISDALYMAESARQEAIFDLGELNEIRTDEGLSELSASGLYNSGRRNVIRGGQKSIAKGFESFRNLRREELITDNGRQLKRADRGEGAGFTSGVPRLAYPEYEAQRGPESGRNEFFGVHYSNVDGLESLNANKHGTGKPGKELLRGWKPRVYFYVQEDENLPMPELKLEDLRHGYGAKLNNVHDPRKDTSITEAVKAKFGAFNIDAFEDAVEAAGYDGYINHSFQPGEGAKALVLIGQHDVPAVQTMINKKRVSEQAIDPSTKKLMYSKKGGTKGAFAPSQTYEDAISRLVYKDTTNPFTRLLGKVVGQVEGETIGQAFVRNTVNRFLPGFILDNIAYGSLANDSNSVGKAMELSQQMSGRMEALINLGALKIDPETGDVSMSDDPENRGIMEIFAPIGEEKKEAYQVYSLARREAKLRQKGRTGLKNLSNEYIQKIISEAPQEFRDVHNNYQKFNDLQIQFAVDSGLITEEMADNLRDMAYVPFYREMEADAVEDLGKAIGKNAGNSLNNPSVFDKKLEGGIIKMGDFYENIVRNNEMILSAALRNVAMRKTADALDRMNQLGITSHGKKLTKKSEGERVLVFRRDGEEQFYQIDDAALWVSIANLTPTQRNAITAFMEIFAGILRSGVTLSPGFMLANLWRGKIDAYVKMGVPLNPITTTIRGMKDAYSGGEASTAIKIRTGIGGYTYGIGQEAFANELRRKYRRKEGGYGPLQRFTDGLSEVKFQLEKVGEATEFAERIAVYDKLMAAGMSEREAAYQAMNLINFGRRGAGGGVFGSFVSALVPMIPFLNARIQGLYRLIEDPNQPQDIRLKMTKEVALRGALVGLGSTALYSLAMQDDRWDEERLDRKLNYDIIYVGDKTIYLPRAFEIGAIFGSLPMLTLETIRKEDGKDLAEGTASIFLNTFAFNPIPQGALPLIETAANFDFFRMAPIEGLSLQRLPAELRAYDSTPEIYKQFGQLFGTSPLKAQQVFEGYTGNMGAGLIGMFDTILGGAGIIPDRPAGVFGDPHSFLGTAASASGITRFIAEDGQRSSRFVSDFYEIKRGINEVYYAIKDAAIRGDQEEIDRLMEEQGVALQYRKQFNRVATRISEINNRMKVISMSPTLSSQQKSDQLKGLREEKNRLTRQMVQAANKVGLY